MRYLSSICGVAAGVFTLVASVAGASAATIDFGAATPDDGVLTVGGFRFETAVVGNGAGDENCGSLDGACLRLGQNTVTTMTAETSGGLFDLNSLSFAVLGDPSDFTIFGYTQDDAFGQIIHVDLGAALPGGGPAEEAGLNDLYTFDFGTSATAVSVIRFINLGTASLALGDLDGDLVSAVPLPAALPLMLSGLAGLGFMGRKRRSASADRALFR